MKKLPIRYKPIPLMTVRRSHYCTDKMVCIVLANKSIQYGNGKRSLAIVEKALGPDHTDVAQSLENYAQLLRNTNREREAEQLEARAKVIRAKHD